MLPLLLLVALIQFGKVGCPFCIEFRNFFFAVLFLLLFEGRNGFGAFKRDPRQSLRSRGTSRP